MRASTLLKTTFGQPCGAVAWSGHRLTDHAVLYSAPIISLGFVSYMASGSAKSGSRTANGLKHGKDRATVRTAQQVLNNKSHGARRKPAPIFSRNDTNFGEAKNGEVYEKERQTNT